MSGLPLHPALVHLPLGLAFVMPFLAVSLAWALWMRRVPRLTWAIVVALQTVLLGGGLVALRTGEAQEDRVEKLVGEAAIARHEVAARQFVWVAALTLSFSVAGLLLKEGTAMRSGLVRLEGPRVLIRAFPGWLALSEFASVERPRIVAG